MTEYTVEICSTVCIGNHSSCLSVCSCHELHVHLILSFPLPYLFLSSICFLLVPRWRLLGCPVRCTYWLCLLLVHFLHSTQAGPSRVTSCMLVYVGQTGRSSSRRGSRERQTEAGSPQRPTARPAAAEADQTGVLTPRCSFRIKALHTSTSFCIMFSCKTAAFLNKIVIVLLFVFGN